MQHIHINPSPLQAVVATYTPSSALADLRTVTAAVLTIRNRSTGIETTLPTTIVSQAENSIVLRGTFPTGSLATIGYYAVRATLTTALGTIGTDVWYFRAHDTWEDLDKFQ